MHQMIGFLATSFIGMTMVNRWIEGAFITSSDVSVMNTLTITHSETIAGIFSIPVLNLDFFFTGIPRLVKWDYGFFGGNAAIIQYFFYTFTFVLAFIFFLVLIGMVGQYFTRRG